MIMLNNFTNLSFKTKPLDHQLHAVTRFVHQDFGAFFCEMGTGKTKMLIDIMGNSPETAGLIIAPNGLHRNWADVEYPKHGTAIGGTDGTAVYVWCGKITTKKDKLEWETFMEAPGNYAHLLMINIEAVRTENGYVCCKQFLEKFPDNHMIIDESSCIKNHRAAQTKCCLKLAKMARRRWILNGTPITQGPLDLFSQCKFLHKNCIPYQTFTAFKNTFAIEKRMILQNRTFNVITGYKNLELLTTELSPFSLRLEKKDCLDLPEKTFQEYPVEKTKEQGQAYEELLHLCLSQLDDGSIVSASMALTKLIKLHQILTGFVKDDLGDIRQIKNNRVKALLDIAYDTKPLVIFCAYRENVRAVTEALAKTYGDESVLSYTGGTDSKDRTEAVRRFQDGEVDFFVGTSAAAKGITLHRASTVVYFSNNYSLETRLQSQDRIHRIGQTNKCTYVDLVIKDTIDDAIIQTLSEKHDVSKMVLDDLKNMIQHG